MQIYYSVVLKTLFVSFGIVDMAKDKDLMSGNTALAWKLLSKKFAGHNNAEKMKLIEQLNESRMKKMKTLMYGLQIWNVYNKESQNLESQLTIMS